MQPTMNGIRLTSFLQMQNEKSENEWAGCDINESIL